MVGGKVGIKSGWLGWLATSHLSPAAAKNYLREAIKLVGHSLNML